MIETELQKNEYAMLLPFATKMFTLPLFFFFFTCSSSWLSALLFTFQLRMRTEEENPS